MVRVRLLHAAELSNDSEQERERGVEALCSSKTTQYVPTEENKNLTLMYIYLVKLIVPLGIGLSPLSLVGFFFFCSFLNLVIMCMYCPPSILKIAFVCFLLFFLVCFCVYQYFANNIIHVWFVLCPMLKYFHVYMSIYMYIYKHLTSRISNSKYMDLHASNMMMMMPLICT